MERYTQTLTCTINLAVIALIIALIASVGTALLLSVDSNMEDKTTAECDFAVEMLGESNYDGC